MIHIHDSRVLGLGLAADAPPLGARGRSGSEADQHHASSSKQRAVERLREARRAWLEDAARSVRVEYIRWEPQSDALDESRTARVERQVQISSGSLPVPACAWLWSSSTLELISPPRTSGLVLSCGPRKSRESREEFKLQPLSKDVRRE